MEKAWAALGQEVKNKDIPDDYPPQNMGRSGMDIGRRAYTIFEKVVETKIDPLEVAEDLYQWVHNEHPPEHDAEQCSRALRTIALNQFRELWKPV